MKKIISVFLIVAMVGAFMFSMSGCGSSEPLTMEKVYGTWSGTWEYDGNKIEVQMEFWLSGTGEAIFLRQTSKNGGEYSLDTDGTGTFKIDGNELILLINGNEGITSTYKYKNGELTQNEHVFIKISDDCIF